MKTDCQVAFREKTEVVQEIDRLAEDAGMVRSSYIRALIRSTIRSAADSK